MLNIKAEELERIIQTLAEAIRMHDHWRDDLFRALICKIQVDTSSLADDAHHRCTFGRWFYSDTNEKLRQTSAFEEIGTLHRLLHISARDICRKYQGSHGTVSVTEYDVLQERMIQFRMALVNMKNRTARTLQSMDRFEATHDQLTNLPNRVDFQRQLQKCIATAKTDGTLLAVLFIDLDNFKPINDTHGHYVGDLLLQDVARRLLGCIREIDTAARLGGDEFAIILHHILNTEIDVICQRVIDRLRTPYNCEGIQLEISASVGIALYPNHGNDECSLLKNADAAMYCATEKGKNQFHYFVVGGTASDNESLQATSSVLPEGQDQT